jgi:cytochrome c oxidase subunit 4
MAHSPEEIRKHVRFYIGVFGALLVLTAITVGLSYVHIGAKDSNTGNMVVGMIIAALKASLVGAFFMHLSAERPLIYRILIFTFIFVIALFLLFVAAFHDGIPAIF